MKTEPRMHGKANGPTFSYIVIVICILQHVRVGVRHDVEVS